MPTITGKITTEKSTWTYDVSIPAGGTAKVLRVYCDVTDKAALDEALEKLAQEIHKPCIEVCTS